jgi:AmpD protein
VSDQKSPKERVGNIVEGIVTGAKQLVSPNFNARAEGDIISLLVVHNISLPPRNFGTPCVEDFFLNKLDKCIDPFFEKIVDLKVSAHLFIKRSGEITQFVNLNDRAWHAGVSSFNGRENCNDFSIGIEMEGTDDLSYEEIQYEVLAYVSYLIEAEYPAVNPANTLGHCDIAPGRKTDPGESFNWQYYQKLRSAFSNS